MAAKGRNKRISKGSKSRSKTEPTSSHEDADLETMERMLEEGDSDSNSEASSQESLGAEESSSDQEADTSEDELEEDNDHNSEEEDEDDVTMTGDEKCNIDLRNLLGFNTHQVNHNALFKKQNDNNQNETTIFVDGMKTANEDYLLEKASEGCSQVLVALWKLETEKTDAGPRANLPSYFETVTPRELPPPPQKSDTKWEKFAKERGIAPKEKRSRKVWDEATGEWGHRTGYQKASSPNDPMSWPIMEVKKNDDPFEDPWERARDAKKDRVNKNTLNKMRNAEKAGELDRGTTRRVMKAKAKDREDGRAGGSLGMKHFENIPSGIPVDMADQQRGKTKTKLALLATQRSTASMGKFDQMRESEPERRKAMSSMKKRKFESGTSKEVVKTEAKKSMKVLENVITGGGRAKERAIRRGDHATGETGHDYDYNDGGYSGFKKKKGRGGIGKNDGFGKMRKITKKLAK